MGSFLAATAPFLGNSAAHQMKAPTARKGDFEMASPNGFTPEELDRRRAASRRLAWVLGASALAIYLLGFVYYRP
jgi:hypothetical protein